MTPDDRDSRSPRAEAHPLSVRAGERAYSKRCGRYWRSRPAQSYRDRSAQGGLAAFIAARVDESPPGSQLHARLQRLHTLLADYADLDTDARPAAIRQAGALVATDPSADQPHRAAGTQRRRPASAKKPAAVRGPRQAVPCPSPAAAANPTAVQARQQSAPRAAPTTSASPAAPAATRRQSDRPAPRRRPPALQLDDPVQRLPRLGAKNAKLLEKLGIHTNRGLDLPFPPPSRGGQAHRRADGGRRGGCQGYGPARADHAYSQTASPDHRGAHSG